MNLKRYGYFGLVLTLVLLYACVPLTSSSNSGQQNGNPVEASGQTLNPNQETAVASAVTPSMLQGNSGNNQLWIKIDQPLDGAVVNSSQIEMKGQAPAGTTISVNDAIVYTESSQDFELTLNLVNGANLFEIIASDVNNNEVTLYLTVYYEP